MTLQAGAACVCNSAAWDAKVVTSAWWCPAEQVRPLKNPQSSTLNLYKLQLKQASHRACAAV